MSDNTTKRFTFANSTDEFEVLYNEDEQPLTVTANPDSENIMRIGTKTRLDKDMQAQVLTAISDQFRFRAYDNELNALCPNGYLQLKTGKDLTDSFAIDSDCGHISSKLDHSVIVALKQKGITFSSRYWPMDPEYFSHGWGIVGQSSGQYWISKANSPLRQARKMNIVRGLQAGLQVRAYVAEKRNLFDMLFEGWLNPNDEEAWQKRDDARKGAAQRSYVNRAARNSLKVNTDLTVAVVNDEEGSSLVDTSEGFETPQTVVANLDMRVFGFKKKTVNLGTLPEGNYTIMSRDGSYVVYSSFHFAPVMTPFVARQWENMITRGLQIELA